MTCPTCAAPLTSPVKFCPNCGSPTAQQPPSPQSTAERLIQDWQAKLASLDLVKQAEQHLDRVALPASLPGQAVPGGAPQRDYIWSGLLALATIASIWFMKWWMWPVFIAVGGISLIYGMRVGISRLMRSLAFLAAGSAGLFALFLGDAYGGLGDLGMLLFTTVIGRGIWGLVKEGLPAAGSPMLEGRRLHAVAAGLAACVISLAFQWRPVTTSVSWYKTGTLYTDGAGRVVRDNTYYAPQLKFWGGDNGADAFLWVLAVGLLLLIFRRTAWPLWVKAGFTVAAVFALSYGIKGIAEYIGFGVILYFLGLAAMTWGAFMKRGTVSH